jgi:hypothetical protein
MKKKTNEKCSYFIFFKFGKFYKIHIKYRKNNNNNIVERDKEIKNQAINLIFFNLIIKNKKRDSPFILREKETNKIHL